MGKLLRCRSNELFKLRGASMNGQMVVEMRVRWHERIHEQLTELTTGLMNQFTSEIMSPWVDETVNRNQSMIQWKREPMNRWFRESMNQRSSDPMNKSMNKFMSSIRDCGSRIFNGSMGLCIKMNRRCNKSMSPWTSQSMSWWIVNQWAGDAVNREYDGIDEWMTVLRDQRAPWTCRTARSKAFSDTLVTWAFACQAVDGHRLLLDCCRTAPN